MPNPSNPPESNDPPDCIDNFIEGVELERRCSAREVIELMRSRLGDVDERVDGETAIFSRDGNDITGVTILENHISLFVPDSGVADKFCRTMGKVEQGPESVRFDQLTDINRAELRKMIDSLDRENKSES